MVRHISSGLDRRVKYFVGRGRNALANLLVSGNVRGFRAQHCADFSEYVARQGGRQDSGFPDKWRVDEQFNNPRPARIAVVVHCYYAELLPDLFARLKHIPVDFDLFVTNASGEEISRPELNRLGHYVVLDVENRGRDIFPMVQLVNSGVLDPYEIILKIHTKKSPWRASHGSLKGDGRSWRDELLASLLGSEEQVIRILDSFASDASLGLVTADGSIVGRDFWGGDQRIAEQLLRRLELSLEPDSLKFASGSMYWIRGFILQGLRALNLQSDDFDVEEGQVDGTTAHAIERIIGILTEEAGLHLVEVSELNGIDDDIATNRGHLYERYARAASRTPRATLIPFYLPQFHESEENNKWWGEGFTEWTNVASAVPVYRGHYQPRIPTDLGFYDLASDRAREKQAHLARAHGISAFMYYYYWFSGKRLLSLPIERMHASDIDLPYCIMWANENWTRRWDGRSEDILIGQDYQKVPADDFIDDIAEFLKDPRYFRVDGKAVLAVYRPKQMANFSHVVHEWRRRARKYGIGELFILAVAVAEEFGGIGKDAPESGIDGTLQFPPHNLPWVAGPANEAGLDSRWRGNFMSYSETVRASLALSGTLGDHEYPGAMVNFDNTARRQWKADTWYGSNPYTFHRWVLELVASVMPRDPADRIVFVNAWNEWAEGAILEPTTRFGRTYLLAIRDALWC
ncbi:MAG: glycoside hydrolase family 99-like domain-containing protein [Ancrocorticia sp.]|nr:glycoside hydrolase family 99-like domain-containing protein [Ancrocorticia sp.]